MAAMPVQGPEPGVCRQIVSLAVFFREVFRDLLAGVAFRFALGDGFFELSQQSQQAVVTRAGQLLFFLAVRGSVRERCPRTTAQQSKQLKSPKNIDLCAFQRLARRLLLSLCEHFFHSGDQHEHSALGKAHRIRRRAIDE